MRPEARVQQTVARVRALVRQLAAPDPALLRLAADADAHVAALEPKLTILEPATFGALASVHHDAREQRHTAASARRGRNTAADPAGPRQSYSPEPTVRAPGSAARGRAWEQLRPRTDSDDSGRRSTPSAPARRSMPALPLTGADTAPDTRHRRGTRAARTTDGTDSTTAVRPHAISAPHSGDAAPVDVGRLADRVRARAAVPIAVARETELGLPAQTSPPAPAREHPSAHYEPPRTALPRTALPLSARVPDARPEPSRSASRSDARTSPVALIPAGSSTAAPVASDTDDAQQRHAAAGQRFLFDPFTTAQVPAPSDDALAVRIDSLLREQARRHGVDLS